MTWSEAFKGYIERRFGDGAQQKAAFALKVSPSKVSYWCRGSMPRERTRKRIDRWSKGEVAASLPPASGALPIGDAAARAG